MLYVVGGSGTVALPTANMKRRRLFVGSEIEVAGMPAASPAVVVSSHVCFLLIAPFTLPRCV